MTFAESTYERVRIYTYNAHERENKDTARRVDFD